MLEIHFWVSVFSYDYNLFPALDLWMEWATRFGVEWRFDLSLRELNSGQENDFY